MAAPENPPGFVVRTEAQKAAFDNGFRLERGVDGGWLRFASTTAQGEIWIAGASMHGPWLLSLGHPGAAAEFVGPSSSSEEGPGVATLVFERLSDLYAAVDRAYRLGASLPDAPLQRFHNATRAMPRTTEAERQVVQRVGQNLFREALLDYWNGRCPLTGITDPALLRASHIVPWAECESDAQRLDVHNGLLLSALWDAAFDKGLVTFEDDGMPLFAPSLTDAARTALCWSAPIPLTDAHRDHLEWHRHHVFDRQAAPAETEAAMEW